MDTLSSLSRTSSAASFSSTDDITPSAINASRRTRKRFTNVQLTMLETLFHRNSHPSREEREAVAKAGQMEIKSVTIWFQNKRQTERKSAANRESAANSRTVSPSYSSGTGGSSRCSSAQGSRPSLDRIASRTELRNHPRTPTRRHNSSGDVVMGSSSEAIWDHMPSSPLVPVSPAASEYIDYSKNARSKRTLEWACAAARVADKDHASQRSHHHHREYRDSLPSHHFSSQPAAVSSNHKHRVIHRQKYEPHSHPEVTPKGMPMDLEMTDDESDEAITPPSTWGREDPRWVSQSGPGMKSFHPLPREPMVADDDDMMKAALALCGLGAGRRVLG